MLQHDPGGKTKTKLPIGMLGDAQFTGISGEYRTWLFRRWAETSSANPAFALWLGLNPSTASSDTNDPTITREIAFTERCCGLTALYKVNCMDYRSTRPEGLILKGINPRSVGNLDLIREFASRATIIIIACGNPHHSLRQYVTEAIAILCENNRQVWCLGKTLAGWPKHPLYISAQTSLVPYRSKT